MDNNDKRKDRAVKCEGRFDSIRNALYEEVIPIVMEDRTMASVKDLKDMWDLAYPQILASENFRDPYFENSRDPLRRSPPESYLALVPLLESGVRPDLDALVRYGRAMGVEEPVSERLWFMGVKMENFLRDYLGREAKDIRLPDGKDLRGYRISSNVGIGTISHGGTSGGGIRSDSPFLLEVYHDNQEKERRGEKNLVSVIGFWPQDDSMLVSQMQSCRNARYPEGVKFGVASLHIAESVARLLGFNRVLAYSAKNHPQFLAHPDTLTQLEAEFKCMWNSSAHKLGFEGCNTKNYSKDLTNGNGHK